MHKAFALSVFLLASAHFSAAADDDADTSSDMSTAGEDVNEVLEETGLPGGSLNPADPVQDEQLRQNAECAQDPDAC